MRRRIALGIAIGAVLLLVLDAVAARLGHTAGAIPKLPGTAHWVTSRAAGVTAELHVWEAMPHGGFGFDAPEDADARREFNDFLERHLG